MRRDLQIRSCICGMCVTWRASSKHWNKTSILLPLSRLTTISKKAEQNAKGSLAWAVAGGATSTLSHVDDVNAAHTTASSPRLAAAHLSWNLGRRGWGNCTWTRVFFNHVTWTCRPSHSWECGCCGWCSTSLLKWHHQCHVEPECCCTTTVANMQGSIAT